MQEELMKPLILSNSYKIIRSMQVNPIPSGGSAKSRDIFRAAAQGNAHAEEVFSSTEHKRNRRKYRHICDISARQQILPKTRRMKKCL